MWQTDGTERSVDAILVKGSKVSKINMLILCEAGISGNGPQCSVTVTFGQSPKIVTSYVSSSAALLIASKVTVVLVFS